MTRGPWSIKGIDSKARQAARDRAQQDGLTLGEYLNRILMDDGAMTTTADYEDDSAERFLDAAHEADTLTRRLQSSPRQSGAPAPQAQPRLRQSLQTILERLEANERGHSTLAGRVDGAMHDLEASQSALRAQVETMSRKDTSRRTLDAMRALEGALSRLAREVYETHEKVNTEQTRLRQQVENGVDRMQVEVEAVNKRVDDTLNDAAERVERAVQQAELRSEGVGRHLAQRMSEVESLISESESRVNDTVERVADSAGRLADFQKTADERVREALSRSEGAVETVNRHTKLVDERLGATEKTAQGAAQMATDAVQKLDTHDKELRQRLKSLANMTDSKLEQVYSVAEEALETAIGRGDELDARINGLKAEQDQTASDLRQKLDAVDANTRRALDETITGLKANQDATTETLKKKLAATDASVRQALTAAAQKTDDLGRRLDEVAAKSASAGDSVARIDAFEKRLDEASHAVTRVDERNRDLAERLFGKVDAVEGKLAEDREAVTRRLDSTQQNVAAMMGRLNDADASIAKVESRSTDALETLRAAMARIDERLDKAEKTSGRIDAIETSVETFDARLSETERKAEDGASALRDDFQQQVDTLTETLTRSLQDTREDLETRIAEATAASEDAASGAAFTQLEERLEAMQAQIVQNESRQAEAVEIISDQFERMSRVLEQRLAALKSDTDAATAQAVRDEVAQLAEELGERISGLEGQDHSAALETMASEVSRLAEKLDEKVRQSEHRSAEAIEQVGDQVIRATERIQSNHDKALEQINSRFEKASRETADRLEAVAEDVNRRLENIGEEAKTAVKPVENTVASLARRLEAIEDLDIGAPPPPFSKDGMLDADDDEDAPPFASLMEEMSPSPKKAKAPVEDDDGLDAAGIAASAHSARREFATVLAAQKAEDETLDDLDADVDIDVEDIAPQEADAADDDLFTPGLTEDDAPAAAFGTAETDSDEPEYEAELPPPPVNSLLDDALRPDVGADDDPFGRASRNNLDFLKAARQAALERGDDNRASIGGAAEPEKRSSRMPLVAASALAIAVAGGAGLMIMRGKQGQADESFATLPAAGQASSQSTGDGESQAHSVGEDGAVLDNELFDAHDGADHADADHAAASHVDEAEVDEDVLFPEDARILTAENLADASHADASHADAGHAAPASPAPAAAPRKVSALEAFASRPSAETTPSLESAAASGDPAALFELATQKFNNGDKRGAAELMQRAADRGSAMAKYRLAKLYEKGEGVPRSVKESRRWTQAAADAGNVKAMHDLAVFYAEGEGGGPQSYVAAVEWFTRAANHGLLDSQYNLGVLYDQGLGVTANPSEAATWFEIAGMNGDADGARRARDLMQRLSPAEADSARMRARAFAPMQADASANSVTATRAAARTGAQPAQVREVQRLLNLLKYDAGTPDGLMGSRTRAAIRSYETSRGLPVTGEVSPALIDALRSQSIGANG